MHGVAVVQPTLLGVHPVLKPGACITADATFRLLHVNVARLFAEQLQKDMDAFREGKSSDVSLAAKWAPTPASESPT